MASPRTQPLNSYHSGGKGNGLILISNSLTIWKWVKFEITVCKVTHCAIPNKRLFANGVNGLRISFVHSIKQ